MIARWLLSMTATGISLCSLGGSAWATDSQAIAAVFRSEQERSGGGTESAAPRSLEWRFERDADSVSVGDLAGRVGEKWLKDRQGRLWYWRIFHKERKIVEYQPADLGIAGISRSWERIAQLIDAQSLGALSRVGERTVMGKQAQVYRGMQAGEEIEVWWLPEENLPARIDKRSPAGHSSLELLRVESESSQTFREPTQDASLSGYEAIEFSDIGDRQHDSFLEHLQQYDGMWHGHSG